MANPYHASDLESVATFTLFKVINLLPIRKLLLQVKSVNIKAFQIKSMVQNRIELNALDKNSSSAYYWLKRC